MWRVMTTWPVDPPQAPGENIKGNVRNAGACADSCCCCQWKRSLPYNSLTYLPPVSPFSGCAPAGLRLPLLAAPSAARPGGPALQPQSSSSTASPPAPGRWGRARAWQALLPERTVAGHAGAGRSDGSPLAPPHEPLQAASVLAAVPSGPGDAPPTNARANARKAVCRRGPLLRRDSASAGRSKRG